MQNVRGGVKAGWPLALVALLVAWTVWFPPSPDLAGQAYRFWQFSTHGLSLWDDSWYGGHYLPGYSLLSPALGALFGLRGLGVIAATASTVAFSRLAERGFGTRAATATALFALGAAGDLFIGRITYAAGVSLAVLGVLAAVNRRFALAALLSLGCAAASPVAAVFLILAATADLIANRCARRAAVVAVPALACCLALAVLFPEGGYEGFSLLSLLPAGGFALALALALPRSQRALRAGAWLYLAMLLFCFVVRTPMGSNAVRLGVLLAPAAWVGAVGVSDVRRVLGRLKVGPGPARAALVLIGLGMVAWQVNGPLAQSVQATGEPSSSVAYYQPVIAFLKTRAAGGPLRIEEPFTASHWDATILARHFALARGWDRQADAGYDPLFYVPRLTAAAYRAWLLAGGVSYVALCDAPLDYSSVQEAALIRRGLPYLHEVFQSAHWRVYRVVGAKPLASGPGRMTALRDDGFTLHAARAGLFFVRVHFTPYWTVAGGDARVFAAGGGYTWVQAYAPGTVTLHAALDLDLP